MMWCSQCKTEKPESEFLPIKRRGWKVTKCDPCARANMAKYSRRVEMDPDAVRSGAVDD